ncbi:MAG TPA: hypothetical protein DEV93_01245 [Chloroflexi bacterium]|nr:hypothetical protein [Chloroflexota bacterium]
MLAVRGCGVFSPDTYRVQLIGGAGRIVVVGESSELGTNRAELEAAIQPAGATAQCTINGKYLVEALEACPGATVLLQFGQPRKPLTVSPIGGTGFWAATSPILTDAE